MDALSGEGGDLGPAVIGPLDPATYEADELVARHLALMEDASPEGHNHALDLAALISSGAVLLGARLGGALVGMGAVKEIEPGHWEVKSMHVAAEARGTGTARALLDALVEAARERGARRISLETGSQSAVEPARRLYARAGFEKCGAFTGYDDAPESTFMTLDLDAPRGA